jgi:hypothetical protein
MSADLGAASGSWPLLLAATCLACVVAALGARALLVRHQTLEAMAIGIVLAFLVDLVPRLTGNAAVGVALLVRAIDAPDLRGQLATNGPVVIQNVATALLFGAFLVSLRFRLRSHRDRELDAILWFVAFTVAAMADGVVTANARASWSAGIMVSLVLLQAMRAFTLGCAFVRSSISPIWVAAAGCACGAAGVLSSAVGRALGFEAASVTAIPLLLVSAVGLVVCISRRLSGGPDRGAARALIGFGLGLGASRLLAVNPL